MADLCLNCFKVLMPGRKKFCCHKCEQRHPKKQMDAREQHSVVNGDIEIVARFGFADQVEWILPGRQVTKCRSVAERVAAQLAG